MTLKLLTEHHLEFLSLKGGCRGSLESTLVKMPHCWKSHVVAHFTYSLNLDPREVMVKYSSLTGTTVTAIREKRLSDVEDFDPDMVILQIGTNDLADIQCTHGTLISAITDLVDTLFCYSGKIKTQLSLVIFTWLLFACCFACVGLLVSF